MYRKSLLKDFCSEVDKKIALILNEFLIVGVIWDKILGGIVFLKNYFCLTSLNNFCRSKKSSN